MSSSNSSSRHPPVPPIPLPSIFADQVDSVRVLSVLVSSLRGHAPFPSDMTFHLPSEIASRAISVLGSYLEALVELDKLRMIVSSFAERIADQSELLSRIAEKGRTGDREGG